MDGSMLERGQLSTEHREDTENNEEDSHVVKHWVPDHPDEEKMPTFRFQIKRCQD